MKKIWIIPPVPKENKKIRVAAYCRVSTFGPAQLHSLYTQIEAYTRMIKNNKDWRFAGVFYDVESGLHRKGRTELDKMLKKVEKGDIFTKYKSFMGYTCVDGEIAIVPEQAEVVRKIFELYLQGLSLGQIKSYLESQGIKTAMDKNVWILKQFIRC